MFTLVLACKGAQKPSTNHCLNQLFALSSHVNQVAHDVQLAEADQMPPHAVHQYVGARSPDTSAEARLHENVYKQKHPEGQSPAVDNNRPSRVDFSRIMHEGEQREYGVRHSVIWPSLEVQLMYASLRLKVNTMCILKTSLFI